MGAPGRIHRLLDIPNSFSKANANLSVYSGPTFNQRPISGFAGHMMDFRSLVEVLFHCESLTGWRTAILLMIPVTSSAWGIGV